MSLASPLDSVDPNTFLNITRTFAAPRDQVYAAWTEPEHLKQWWGPEGRNRADRGDRSPDRRALSHLHAHSRRRPLGRR